MEGLVEEREGSEALDSRASRGAGDDRQRRTGHDAVASSIPGVHPLADGEPGRDDLRIGVECNAIVGGRDRSPGRAVGADDREGGPGIEGNVACGVIPTAFTQGPFETLRSPRGLERTIKAARSGVISRFAAPPLGDPRSVRRTRLQRHALNANATPEPPRHPGWSPFSARRGPPSA